MKVLRHSPKFVLILLLIISISNFAHGIEFHGNSQTCSHWNSDDSSKIRNQRPNSETINKISHSIKTAQIGELNESLRVLLEYSLILGKIPQDASIKNELNVVHAQCRYANSEHKEMVIKAIESSLVGLKLSTTKEVKEREKRYLVYRMLIALLEIARIDHVLQTFEREPTFASINPGLDLKLKARLVHIFSFYPQLRVLTPRNKPAVGYVRELEEDILFQLFGPTGMGKIRFHSGAYTTHPYIDDILFTRKGLKKENFPKIAKIFEFEPFEPLFRKDSEDNYQKVYNFILTGQYINPWIEQILIEQTHHATQQTIRQFGRSCSYTPCEALEINLVQSKYIFNSVVAEADRAKFQNEICGCQLQAQQQTFSPWIVYGGAGAAIGTAGACLIGSIYSLGFAGVACGIAAVASIGSGGITYQHMQDTFYNEELMTRIAQANSTGIVANAIAAQSAEELVDLQRASFWNQTFFGLELLGGISSLPELARFLMGFEKIGNAVSKGARVVTTPSKAFGPFVKLNKDWLKNGRVDRYIKLVWDNHDNFGRQYGQLAGFSQKLDSLKRRLKVINGRLRVNSYFLNSKNFKNRPNFEKVFEVINTLRKLDGQAQIADEQMALINQAKRWISLYLDYQNRVEGKIRRGFESTFQVEDIQVFLKGGVLRDGTRVEPLTPSSFSGRLNDAGQPASSQQIPIRYVVAEDQIPTSARIISRGEGFSEGDKPASVIVEVDTEFHSWEALQKFYSDAVHDSKRILSSGLGDELTNSSELLDLFFEQAELNRLINYLRVVSESRTNGSMAHQFGGPHAVHTEIRDLAVRALQNTEVRPRSDAIYRLQYKEAFAEFRLLVKRRLMLNFRSGYGRGHEFQELDEMETVKTWIDKAKSFAPVGILYGGGSLGVTHLWAKSPEAYFFGVQLDNYLASVVRHSTGYTSKELECAMNNREWNFIDAACVVDLSQAYLIDYYHRAFYDKTYNPFTDANYIRDLQEYRDHLMNLSLSFAIYSKESYWMIRDEFKGPGYRMSSDAQLVAMVEENWPMYPELGDVVEEMLIASRFGDEELVQTSLQTIELNYPDFGTQLASDLKFYLENLDQLMAMIGRQGTLARGDHSLERLMDQLRGQGFIPRNP